MVEADEIAKRRPQRMIRIATSPPPATPLARRYQRTCLRGIMGANASSNVEAAVVDRLGEGPNE